MDYSRFTKVFHNSDKQIQAYKYNVDLEENTKKHFQKCFDNWNTVSDEDIMVCKEMISKLTDNNINIRGSTTNDTISLNNDNHSIHYYVRFNKKNVELWYIKGVYQEHFNDSFDFLLMILSY